MRYSGVLHGNGHSIKNLVMNNTGNSDHGIKYEGAGLFCCVEDATIENIIIDKTCSFAGSGVGSLTVLVSGGLNLTNVTNQAAISGQGGLGGFIGYISEIKQEHKSLVFDECTNDGNVIGNDHNVAGFAGFIACEVPVHISISNCVNNGMITGGWVVGGFSGNVYDSGNMTLFNFTNNGNVTAIYELAGGFSAYFASDSETTITTFINNGNISSHNRYAGGFFGYGSLNSCLQTTISHSKNTGSITGTHQIGGFFGSIYSYTPSKTNIFKFINCENKGTTTAFKGKYCGFFCTNDEMSCNLESTILNSINKGNINSGNNVSFGFSDVVSRARNVVSMGKINGTPTSNSFWSMSTETDLVYGLKDNCVNCHPSTTLFEYKTETGFYDVTGSGDHMHDVLNNEALKQRYGATWTTDLELVRASSPSIGVVLIASPSLIFSLLLMSLFTLL